MFIVPSEGFWEPRAPQGREEVFSDEEADVQRVGAITEQIFWIDLKNAVHSDKALLSEIFIQSF